MGADITEITVKCGVNDPYESLKCKKEATIKWHDDNFELAKQATGWHERDGKWVCGACFIKHGHAADLQSAKQPKYVKIVCEVDNPPEGEHCFVSQKIAAANQIDSELRKELDRQEFVRLGWTEKGANRWICPVCKIKNRMKSKTGIETDCFLDSIRSAFNILLEATKDGAAGTFEYNNDDIEISIKFK